MEYITGKCQVIINFAEKFCKTEVEVLSSACLEVVWSKYVDHLYKTENQAFSPVLNVFTRSDVKTKTIRLFMFLLEFSLEEVQSFDPFYNQSLNRKDVWYDLVQNFYEYWRKLERYAVVFTRATMDGIETASFM
jgi:hypothetical protein